MTVAFTTKVTGGIKHHLPDNQHSGRSRRLHGVGIISLLYPFLGVLTQPCQLP